MKHSKGKMNKDKEEMIVIDITWENSHGWKRDTMENLNNNNQIGRNQESNNNNKGKSICQESRNTMEEIHQEQLRNL